MKKTIAFIISLALVFAFLPHFEIKSKAWTNHIGTEHGSVQDLCNLRDAINSDPSLENIDIFFNQNDIIDLTGINWEPIKHYTGHIYGNGATIRGLTIDPYEGAFGKAPTWSSFASYNNIGFISIADGAEIENLTIKVNHIEGHHLVGAFCGQAMRTYIHDCIVGADNTTWELQSGVISGICGVGGFAGGFSQGSTGVYTDYDSDGILGGYTEGAMINCRTLYPLQIFTCNNWGARTQDPTAPYSINMNPQADYVNAPDYVCTNITAGSYYNYPPAITQHGVPTGAYDDEGFFAGGLVGLTWETPCNFYGCINNAFVSSSLYGGGGIIGYTLNGAMIRNCTNNGYILGSDRGECKFTDDYSQYFCNNRYLMEMPKKALRHYFNYADYYECNLGYGGIVGMSGAGTVIEDCSNNGPIEAHSQLGGIVGMVLEALSDGYYCTHSRITNCYNTGNLFTNEPLELGGIAGSVAGFASISNNGRGCPHCNNGSLQTTASGRCDNIIENSYNVGELLAKEKYINSSNETFYYDFPVYPEYYNQFGGTVSSICYGGITAINNGVIRNCYSNLDSNKYTVSICLQNNGLIDHCFGRSINAQGTQGCTGTVTDYGRFTDATGLTGDLLDLVNQGTLSGSFSLIDELNRWVDDNVFYQFFRGLGQYAVFSYYHWTTGTTYDVFGSRTQLFKLEYNANGGANAPATQYGNGLIFIAGTAPVLSGSTFSYWEETGPQTQYFRGASINLTQDTMLMAVWDRGESSFKIVYDDNGGSGGPPSQTGSGYIELSTRAPNRYTYDFLGWDTSSAANTAVYQPGDWVYLTANMNLYAVWELQTVCTLTYNLNGGIGTAAPVTQPRGTVITLDDGRGLTRNGYNFFGWALSPTATVPDYAASAQYALNGTTTLYAVWLPDGVAPVSCNVYYYSNDGTNNCITVSSFVGSTLLIDTGSSFSYSGHTFLGWSTTSSATAPDPAYTPGGQFTLTGNLVLYAVWAQDVTLTYNPNGGSNAPQSQTGYGQITLSNVRPFKSGCNFLGWTTTPHAVNPLLYSPGSTFNLTQNTTLYACWENATAVTTESATPSFEAGTRGSQLTWTVLTPKNTTWVKLRCSYETPSGASSVTETNYKYATYLNVDGMTSVSDTEDGTIWVITLPVTYTGTADSVVQTWTVLSKAKGSSSWEIVPVEKDSANADGSVNITVAKTQAVLNSIEGKTPEYVPNTLLSIDADRDCASVGEYVYFTVVTSPDVSKVRISYVNADTGKKKASTYQTSSTSVMSYTVSDDSSNAIWVIRYKVSGSAQGNTFTAECRGDGWASPQTVKLYVT